MSTALVRALTAYAAARGGNGPFATAIPGLTLLASDRPKPPMPLVHKPALCIVAQGAKQGIFGETHLEYRAGEALVVGIETPARGWVTEASAESPFLGMVIEFDAAVVSDVLGEIGRVAGEARGGGVFVAEVGPELDACAVRLVRLLDRPEAIPVIAPLIARELCYWLLTAPYGERVAATLADAGRAHGIVTAIQELRTRFAEPLRIGALASAARMSASTFHRQFKIVTSMSPIQYQKQLRLLEARHLMAADGANAETAAFRVGYESQSQFSREYARMFGAPPRRDTAARTGRLPAQTRV